MYKLMIVKDGAAMEADFGSDVPEKYGHGTKVLVNLVKGLEMSGRLIVADSFFASVEATQEMMSRVYIFWEQSSGVHASTQSHTWRTRFWRAPMQTAGSVRK